MIDVNVLFFIFLLCFVIQSDIEGNNFQTVGPNVLAESIPEPISGQFELIIFSLSKKCLYSKGF